MTKVNDVLKVLDFPDNQEEAFRKILLKQDDTTLEELATKSKKEILAFLIQTKETETVNIEAEESQKQNIKNERIEQKLSKIKSVFTPKILEQNSDIADKFKELDSEKDDTKKDEILQSILSILKNPKRLEAIVKQL